jgi:phycoerythrin-associated linker protein
MTTTFVNPTLNPDINLGINRFDETAPIQLSSSPRVDELEIAIAAIYRQVLGNAYVMESERQTTLESRLCNGEISVRQFVRQLAKSELYRSRFMDGCSRNRSIELNFKHLLGRAPENYDETSAHSHILDAGGWDAEIDAYIDSDEYQQAFGENTVPHYRGYKTQVGKNLSGFTHMFKVLRGASSSDKDLASNNCARLNESIASNTPSQIVPLRGVNYGPIAQVEAIASRIAPEYYYHSIPAPTSATSVAPSDSAQDRLIATLKKQLAELSSSASIGLAQLSGDWNTTSGSNTQSGGNSKAAQIKALESQIADARRYAAIGDARLNKWRSRSY